MAAERIVLCGGVDDKRLPQRKREPLRLRMWGEDANVRLTIEQFRKSMAQNVPPAFLDLVDIATYVYCADGALTRAGGGDPDGGRTQQIGNGWRRRIYFRIPVRRPELWRNDDVQAVLCDTLSFLSDDYFSFDFVRLPEGPKTLQPYLAFGDKPFDGRIDEVALFSGGLDSLAGAVKEAVVEGRDVALVGHRPTSKNAGSSEALVAGLTTRAARKPVYLPFRVNKKKSLGREFTQRTRSFLFAALAATVAATLGRPRIRFFENGVVSLNLPLAMQVVGARATRTTHPRVLRGFETLFSQVADSAFHVENPFFRMTKTDVVESIANAGCAELIAGSRSCARTIRSTTEHPHCGTCSQCIDRRFATLAAGQAGNDPGERYAVDLVTGAREDEESRAMLASYVNTATRIGKMNAAQFFSEYGEIARALPYVDGGSQQAAEDIFNLLRRHASQVSGVVDQAIREHAPALRELSVVPTSLIGLVAGSYATSTVEPDRGGSALVPAEFAEEANLFRRQGTHWIVRFRGGTHVFVRHTIGMDYLKLLLSRPGVSTSVEDLERELHSHDRALPTSFGTDVVDEEGIASYREKLAEARGDIARAKDFNDYAAEAEAAEEVERLLAALGEANAPGGRIRQLGDARENARKRVGAAIRRAVKDIGRYVPGLAAHFKSPTLRLGYTPSYCPGQNPEWHVSDLQNSAALREK